MIPYSDHPLAAEDMTNDLSSSVAVLAPRGRDATVAQQLLDREGFTAVKASSLEHLAEMVEKDVGAAVLTEESIAGPGVDRLKEALGSQPAWSDVPFIVLANGAAGSRSKAAERRIDDMGNVVLLSRPLHAEELVRAVRSALKARRRQHDARVRMEELQARENELYESEAKLQAITDSVDQMIWSTRPDGFHDYYNQRWYDYTGVPEGTTDGEAWNGMFHAEDQERAWKVWRHSLKTGEPYEIEYRLRHRSGEYRWVLGRALPVRDREGRILRWYGTCTDIHELKVAEEQRKLMLAEMNHRVKNSLAMVQAVVSQTLRQADSIEDAREGVLTRVRKLAEAHDRLIRSTWREARLGEVVEAALAPHQSGEERITVKGADLEIGSKQSLALTMALHELATNAAKYGALSNETGEVLVEWSVSGNDGESGFRFSWTEKGGPPVTRPERRGFGTRMIENALPSYFFGTGELFYRSGGLVFEMNAPVEGLTR